MADAEWTVPTGDPVEAMKYALESIRRYGLDTLSGRTDGPADVKWHRDGVNEMTKRARLGLEAAAAAQPAASDVPHDVVRALEEVEADLMSLSASCSDEPTSDKLDGVAGRVQQLAAALATPAPSTSTEEAADAEVTESCGCVYCDLAVLAFHMTPHGSTKPCTRHASTEEALRAENARLRAACSRLDAYWLETFPEGPDGDVSYAKGLGRLADECIDLWRDIRSALSR